MTAPLPLSDTAQSGVRLAALRAELARRGVDGFIVPRADAHQGEYIAACDARLTWLTGFGGSAGFAIVLADQAAIFVDGRYTLQVRDQIDVSLFTPRHVADEPAADWLAQHLKAGQKLAYDPWLHTVGGLERLRAACVKTGAELVALSGNPVDKIWHDRPAPPLAPLAIQGDDLAGETAADKRQRVGRSIADAGADAAVLTMPDSIAWLLNIRGGDIPRTPVALCFAVLHADGRVDLFIDHRKLTPQVETHLGDQVALHAPAMLDSVLQRLTGAVLLDPASAAAWFFDRLDRPGVRIVRASDPCELPKACKNPVELAGMRAAHLRDGAALTRFLAWLDQTAPHGGIDELTASDHLYRCRAASPLLRDLSFDTISGAGPNGAIVHYHSTPVTNRPLRPGELYLVDSGGQYPDGTTDVTRTVAIGAPDAEQRDRFTRVLKGHIALATARFPKGTTGSQLDVLARLPLWQAGLDFDHGTGHGVGHYLAVHEGPQRISKIGNSVALQAGMVVSNEPGYYKTGAYGIRIENLVTVRAASMAGERDMFEFETLTLAPIDRKLIEPALLTPDERAWLNGYHARVAAELSPLLEAETVAWLTNATAPIDD